MTQQQYRTQLEDQVKDLIVQYAKTHGEAPAVTIEWGKVATAAPKPGLALPLKVTDENTTEEWVMQDIEMVFEHVEGDNQKLSSIRNIVKRIYNKPAPADP